MAKSPQIDIHTVFIAHRKGDTLLVMPKGDTVGFSPNQVQVEVNSVIAVFKDPAVRHLILDLGDADYFGSEMIGLINKIGLEVRSTGGRTVLCNVSTDMRDILGVMKFEQLWEMFDAKSEAVKDVVTESLADKMAAHQTWLIAALIIIAAVLVIAFFPYADANKKHYQSLLSIRDRIVEMHKPNKSNNQRTVARSNIEKELMPLIRILEKKAGEGDQIAVHLHKAAREGLRPMLKNSGPQLAGLKKIFSEQMSKAAALMEGVSPPDA